jgi:hypothetical protein
VPAAQYTFTGYVTTGYQDYRDTGTGKMLVADPGGSYGIQAIDLQLAVPPPDGRWTAAEVTGGWDAAPWEPPPSPPPVPEVPEVPSVPEPGEGEQA